MPMGKYLERRDIQVTAFAGFFILLLVLAQYGPFLAYGIPAITFHTVDQTTPETKSVTILNSVGDWVSYNYYGEAHFETVNQFNWWGRKVDVALSATLKIKLETSDLALGGFLTEIKPPPFLINETEAEILYKNMTVQAYSYGFKITTAWSGSVGVTIVKTEEWGIIPWTVASVQDMVKSLVRDQLVPDFNTKYLTAAKLLLSIDGPTLGKDKFYELRPDYLGIAGMWLTDYQVKGYTTGTAAEMLPQSTGTAVKLYRDSDLTQPCWAPDYDSLGNPLLTPDVVYWLDHFTPSSGWWTTSIVNIGSQLVYDDTKAYPNLISWAWEKYGKDTPIQAPSVAQWFRVDLVFRTTKDWTVPKIPQYELPQAEKDKMKVIITVEPQNQGTPLTQPSVTAPFPWTELYWLLLIVFGGLVVVITVYYVVKRKVTVKT